MDSLILRTGARLLLPVMLLFSLVILFRGHNDPGGGFIGGLIAASGIAVHALGHGREAAIDAMRVDPLVLIGVGLLLALSSGIAGLAIGETFLTHVWLIVDLGFTELPLGTALIFDLGVYLVVLGAATSILFEFMER